MKNSHRDQLRKTGKGLKVGTLYLLVLALIMVGILAGRYGNASSGERGIPEAMDARNALRLAGVAAGYLLHRRVGTVENLACTGLSAGISSSTAAHRRRQHIILSGLRVLHFSGVGG